MGRKFIRTVGLARAKVEIGLMNLTCNLMRYRQFTKDRAGAPAIARSDQREAEQVAGQHELQGIIHLISSCGISKYTTLISFFH